MMKKLFAVLLCMLILAGCKDEPHDLGLAEDASFMFGPYEGTQWMVLPGAHGQSSPEITYPMIVNPHENWLKVSFSFDRPNWRIYVSVTDNPNDFKRYAVLNIKEGKASSRIYVEQGPNETAKFATERQILKNTSGEFTARFRTAGTPELVIRMTDPWNSSLGPTPWISFGELKEVGDDTYEVPVSYKANDGFGRIAQLVVNTRHSQSGLTIIQLPKKFEESETMVTDYSGGSMALMLGCVPGSMVDYDMDNIGRIRHLKIDGGIGRYDLEVLRMLTKSPYRPISLDLGDAWFVSSSRPANPYESFGYTPPKPEEFEVILADNYIPDRLFNMCMGLDEIVLPSRTVNIGSSALSQTPIKRMAIPANVRAIESGVFRSCNELTEINIDKSSQLETLGDYAFYTNSKRTLEALYLPATLENVSADAFRLMNVKRLYLDMNEPPAWELTKAVVDTLFVPDEKLIDVYRAAPGWSDIPEIRAWPAGWKESPWP